jgi:hypothetical protein
MEVERTATKPAAPFPVVAPSILFRTTNGHQGATGRTAGTGAPTLEDDPSTPIGSNTCELAGVGDVK